VDAICPHGALADAAWAQHCQSAALPSVPQVVHTFFEERGGAEATAQRRANRSAPKALLCKQFAPLRIVWWSASLGAHPMLGEVAESLNRR